MEYLLHDKQGFVVASTGGSDVFEGKLTLKNPNLWWPIGMSDQPAYLYTFKVDNNFTLQYAISGTAK